MSSFDAAAWQTKAEIRRDGALKKGRPPEQVDKEFKNDLFAISALRVVVEWCNTRGLTVDFCRAGSCYYGQSKLILINSRVLPETQLHYLLHECGHHLVDGCTSQRKKRRRWTNGYGSQQEGRPKRGSARDLHAVEIVDEEYEAWDRGQVLAERLGIMLNTEVFHKHKVVAIKSYFRWALRPS